MVGTILTEIRAHIEGLASDAGDFYLVCGRTGDRPVPAETLRFETRETAQKAARATEQYRSTLRQYDPRLPYYDLIVCQDVGPLEREAKPASETAGPPTDSGSESGPVSPSADGERQQLVEFCHRTAAAIFETLSDSGYDDVERAVMDAYFDLAETVSDPDDLCLRLLESMAAVLDERLDPGEQAALLAAAGARLQPVESSSDPVDATLATLQRCGVVGAYSQSPTSMDLDGGMRSVEVRLSEYALSPQNGRLPVLPVVLDLYRRDLTWDPASVAVAPVEDGWRLTLEFARSGEQSALLWPPIGSGV